MKNNQSSIINNHSDTIFCPRCKKDKPATLEYFWKNPQYDSGLNECFCKVCGNKKKRANYAGVDHVDYVDHEYDFDVRAMAEYIKRMNEPVISIFQPINFIAQGSGDGRENGI